MSMKEETLSCNEFEQEKRILKQLHGQQEESPSRGPMEGSLAAPQGEVPLTKVGKFSPAALKA